MALENARRLLNFFQNRPGQFFERLILTNTSVTNVWVDGKRTRVECSLPVLPEFSNSYGPLHGGAATTIVDEFTSLAVWVADRQPRQMVSTDLSVSFVNAAFAGEVLRVVSTCDKVGKNIAFASAELFVEDKLIATGKHTLFMMNKPLFEEESKL